MGTRLRLVLDEAESSLYAELPRATLALCRLALQEYPRCIRAYVLMAAALWLLGDAASAARSLRVILQVDPEHLVARYLLGLVLEDDDLDQAIAELSIAFSQSPGDAEISQALQRLYKARDRSVPTLRPGRDALARWYAKGGLWGRALAEAADLVVSRPERLDLRLLLVEAEWRTGQIDQAAALCQDLLLNYPNCLKANLILGDIWQSQGKVEAAQALFQRARDLDPENRLAMQLFTAAGRPLPFVADEPVVGLEVAEDGEALRAMESVAEGLPEGLPLLEAAEHETRTGDSTSTALTATATDDYPGETR
jgi:tetratricopeptide (TPR) repeat protein